MLIKKLGVKMFFGGTGPIGTALPPNGANMALVAWDNFGVVMFIFKLNREAGSIVAEI